MIRVGIIGCGRIVELGHIPAFSDLRKNYRVVALADPAPEQLELVSSVLAKAGLPQPAIYQDYRRMLEQEQLDAVDMALPHFLHHRAVLDAAEARIPIITEKPLAVSVAEAEEMISACRRNRVPLFVLHNYLWGPACAKAHELVRAGAIGKPFLMRSEGLGGGHWPGTNAYDPDWRTKADKAGGGCLIDNGYHNLYSVRALLQSDVESVFACVQTYNREINVDDTALLMLKHRNGATSSVQVSWSVSAGGQVVQEVHGTEGSISFTKSRDGTPAPIAVFSNRTGKWSFPSVAKFSPNSFTGILKQFAMRLEAWNKSGRKGDVPTNADDALRNLQIIEAAYESARTGQVVRI